MKPQHLQKTGKDENLQTAHKTRAEVQIPDHSTVNANHYFRRVSCPITSELAILLNPPIHISCARYTDVVAPNEYFVSTFYFNFSSHS